MAMASRRKTKGTSLAKGPVGVIGLALLVYGITALIFGGHSFAHHVPSGTVHGKTWLGLEVNGWSGLLFVAAGLLLLLAAPLHWSAKGMSGIVAVALAAVALIALVNGHGALGIFAANHLTELVWGAAAALLLILSYLPRVGGRTQARVGDSRRPRATPRGEPAPHSSGPADLEPGRAEHAYPEPERAYPERGRAYPEPEHEDRDVRAGEVRAARPFPSRQSTTAVHREPRANGAPTDTGVAPASGTNPNIITEPATDDLDMEASPGHAGGLPTQDRHPSGREHHD
jgi:hypothetical protein